MSISEKKVIITGNQDGKAGDQEESGGVLHDGTGSGVPMLTLYIHHLLFIMHTSTTAPRLKQK